MSAYTTAVLGTSGLVAYYQMTEASGLSMVDSAAVAGNATYEASGVAYSQPSLLPGDSNTCVAFDGTSGRAVLGHNSSINLTQGISIVAWIKPTFARTQHIMYKFGSYGISLRGAYLSWELAGVGTIWSPVNSIVSNNTYMIAGTFTGNAQTAYINGVNVGSASYSNLSLTQSANALEIGSVIGLERWAGNMAHVALFNVGLSQAAIQNLYVLGAQTQAEAAGLAAQVHPFSRQVVASNLSRTKLTIWNDSDTAVYLSLGGTAAVGSGPRLNGNGDRWTTTAYTGAISAIHNGFLGGKNITIQEE